jgi:pyridoxal 5'-phosphate synthase pdxT subunit
VRRGASVSTVNDLTIGVLALQGDVREHIAALEASGARAVPVRRAGELDDVAGLVIPGGESTTMWKLAVAFELYEPVRKRLADGMPAYGSCAGMIMLADRVLDAAEGQLTFGGIAMTVRRNAFGRQIDSFEGPIAFAGVEGDLHGVFIRAPWVEEVDADAVEVLARVTAGPGAGRIVAVRQGRLIATSFHPELTGDHRVHGVFVDLVRAAR